MLLIFRNYSPEAQAWLDFDRPPIFARFIKNSGTFYPLMKYLRFKGVFYLKMSEIKKLQFFVFILEYMELNFWLANNGFLYIYILNYFVLQI